jgi:hypothetical protein
MLQGAARLKSGVGAQEDLLLAESCIYMTRVE